MKNIQAVIAIDPGKKGAAALLFPGGLLFRDWSGVTDKQRFDVLRTWTQKYAVCAAVLEKVGARPEQGVNSMFTFGTNFGWWCGLLDALGLSWSLVSPQTWQKGVVPSKGGKEAAVRAASRMFPNAVFHGPKGGLLDGRADAALMAVWAARHHGLSFYGSISKNVLTETASAHTSSAYFDFDPDEL